MLGLAYALYGSHALMHWIQDDRVLWADEIVQIWTRFGRGVPWVIGLRRVSVALSRDNFLAPRSSGISVHDTLGISHPSGT